VKLKLSWSLALCCFAAGAVILTTATLIPARAYPTTAPSAVAAVRLKYHPPDNWIRHYLGDDRYKIAGQVWKVVSTQTDTYYHRPNCPNMLRQPADIVIGFASADEAEQSGYVPDPLCAPRANSVTYLVAQESATINRSKRAVRIVLADRKSTVLLPPSWKRTRSGAQTVLGYALLSDTLQPLRGSGSLRFAFINAPGGMNVEPFLQADKFAQLAQLVAANNKSSEAANYLKNARIASGALGGRSGLTITPRSTSAGAEVRGPVTVAGRGSKVYILENNGSGADAKTIINSFQPR
jgi:hypothetical protein